MFATPRCSPARFARPRAVALTALGMLAACEGPLDPQARLLLSELSVSFEAIVGSESPQSRTIAVQNAGGGRLGPLTCSAQPASWLTCSVTEGSRIVLVADPTGLTEAPAPVAVPLTAPGLRDALAVTASLELLHPSLALSPASLAFSAPEGATMAFPPSTTVQMTNVGAGTGADLGPITCTPDSDRITCAVDAAGGSLSVSIDPAGLEGGTYVHTVEVTSGHGGARTFTVALEVAAAPRIVLAESSLDFVAIRGSELPLLQSVQVMNGGSGSLGTIGCPVAPEPWLTCTVEGSFLSIAVNPTDLLASPPPVQVPVTATEAANAPQLLTVRLELEQPRLGLEGSMVTLVIPEGAEGPQGPVRMGLLNEGAGSLESLGDVACSVPDGLPFTCEVESDDSESWQLALRVPDPEGLAQGLQVHSIPVTAQHSEGLVFLTVVLSVAPPAPVSAHPSALEFQFAADAVDPVERIVELRHAEGAPLGTLSCDPAPAAWLTCQVDGDDDGDWFVLTAFPALLTESPAPVIVVLEGSDVPEAPVELAVGAILLHEMALSSEFVTFEVSAGGEATVPQGTAPTPAARSVVLTREDGGSLTSLGALGCLAGTRVTCEVDGDTGEATLSVDPEGLAPGTHHFVAILTAEFGSNAPRPVVLALEVTP